MISSDDFPCYVSTYTQEKCNPHKEGLSVDEVRYFTNMNQYLNWLVDVDTPKDQGCTACGVPIFTEENCPCKEFE